MKKQLDLRPSIHDLQFKSARKTPDPNSENATHRHGEIGYVSVDGGVVEVEFSDLWDVWVVLTSET